MKIPAGTQTGSRFRLRNQGLRIRNGGRGDQFVRVKVAVPSNLSAEEKELFRKLQEVSEFNPRG
jgi:DnaJ-class molecular chaperone